VHPPKSARASRLATRDRWSPRLPRDRISFVSIHSCCPKVRAFLRAIGVEAVDPTTPDGWLLHFAQEEQHLFPRLAAPVVATFTAAHALFRHELATFGEIRSLDVLRDHSREEDQIVGQIMRNGLTLWRAHT
jgi:hypothetical protein